MSGEPLTLTAAIHVREGCEERFLAAASTVIPPTRAEAGCIEYRLHRNDQSPGTFSFYEIWRTDEDLDHHMETPHIAAFIAAIEPPLIPRESKRLGATFAGDVEPSSASSAA